jgi:hypothetical protein
MYVNDKIYSFSCTNGCFLNAEVWANSDVEAIGFFNHRTSEIILDVKK